MADGALPDPKAVLELRLGDWFTLKARIEAEAKPLIDAERSMRAELFGAFFPSPKEGANDYTLSTGHVLKGVYPIDRKVDPGIVAALRTLRVGQLEPAMVQELHLDTAPPDQLVTEALRLNVDELLKWTPEVDTKVYRELTDEQRKVFDRCLTIKPGSLSMKIADPPKRGQPKTAAGFGPA